MDQVNNFIQRSLDIYYAKLTSQNNKFNRKQNNNLDTLKLKWKEVGISQDGSG